MTPKETAPKTDSARKDYIEFCVCRDRETFQGNITKHIACIMPRMLRLMADDLDLRTSEADKQAANREEDHTNFKITIDILPDSEVKDNAET